MSPIQRFFTAIFPASWAKSMEADSRKWMMRCDPCGFERSYWDMGGIRWKAYGNQKTYMKCISCGDRSWHSTHKREDPPLPN